MKNEENIAISSKLEVYKLSAKDLSDMLSELIEKEYFNYIRELFADDPVARWADLASGKGIYPPEYLQKLATAASLALDVEFALNEAILSKKM